jgi:hypothetical protein
MKIHKRWDTPYNFRPELQPLFDAMAAGKRIKSVTCCKGSMNWNKPELDYHIENFIADCYYHNAGWSESKGHSDYVDCLNGKRSFYMNNVRTFEL